jgi:uncharacterized protein (TIGR03067 family)
VVRRARRERSGNRSYRYRSSGPGSEDANGTVEVDPSKSPKEITLTREDGKQTKGIYERRTGSSSCVRGGRAARVEAVTS